MQAEPGGTLIAGGNRTGRAYELGAAAWPDACMNKVTLGPNDGERRSASVRYYRGHALNPTSDEELQRTFTGQAVPVLGDAAADQLATVIWGLGKAEHITELFGVAATAEES